MNRIKALMWLSLIVVTLCLGVSCGGSADKKAVVKNGNPRQVEKVFDLLGEYRNPKLVELVIDKPKEYPGFFYPVCDEYDPEYFQKNRHLAGLDPVDTSFSVIEVYLKGGRAPFDVWSYDRPLPLAYNSAELTFWMLHRRKVAIRDLYVLEDGKFCLCKPKNWRKEGLMCDSVSHLNKFEVSNNYSGKMQGWVVVFQEPLPKEALIPDPVTGLTYGPFTRVFPIMQLPMQKTVSLDDIKQYADTFLVAHREYLSRFEQFSSCNKLIRAGG